MREVTVDPFEIAATTVTNTEFAAFVEATGYTTDAERYGWSFVFAGFLPRGFPPTRAVAQTPWWRQAHDAYWRSPEGPASGLRGRWDHPVDAFEPNGYGLFNTTGNVWEWCADWFSPGFHKKGPRENPTGPRFGEARVLKGGSHLCHESYCFRYRTSARMGNTPDSSTGNTGFRVVR